MQLSTADEIRGDDDGRGSKKEESGKLAVEVEAEGGCSNTGEWPPARCRPQKILLKHLLLL